MADVWIFANPIAGKGRGAALAERIARRLAAEGLDARVELSRPDDDALAAMDLPSARAVVVIGGDGTLRAVASKVMRHCPGTPPALLVAPMGTANLMGRHLGLSWGDKKASERIAAAILGGRIVELDAAECNGELFLLMAGAGIDAHIVHELDRMRRGPINLLSYAMPAMKTATEYGYRAIEVRLDGRRVFGPRAGIAFVGNVREYGTGFAVLPEARGDDGLLDLCAIPCRNQLDVPAILLHAMAGEHTKMEGVVCGRGRRIEIDSPLAVPVQLDGDAAGFTPIDIRMLERKMRFLVP